jgi:hypothetical protein
MSKKNFTITTVIARKKLKKTRSKILWFFCKKIKNLTHQPKGGSKKTYQNFQSLPRHVSRDLCILEVNDEKMQRSRVEKWDFPNF